MAYRKKVHTSLGPREVEVDESNQLSNIDGFLVTDGYRLQVTLRAQLSKSDKEAGLQALVSALSHGQTGLVWNRTRGVSPM